jgi:hypothetical protein
MDHQINPSFSTVCELNPKINRIQDHTEVTKIAPAAP